MFWWTLLVLYAMASYHVGSLVWAAWLFPLMYSWRCVPGSGRHVVARAIAAEARPFAALFLPGQVAAVGFLFVTGRPIAFFYALGVLIEVAMWWRWRHEPRGGDRWRRRRRALRRAAGSVLARRAGAAHPVGGRA